MVDDFYLERTCDGVDTADLKNGNANTKDESSV